MRSLTHLFLFLLLALGGVAAGYAAWRVLGSEVGASADVEVIIDGRKLVIPKGYLRRKDSGETWRDSVDLVARFPTLDPPGGTPPVVGERLFISIQRVDTTLDPAERPAAIYGRFLEADIWRNPGGLLMRRFQPESPYADEDLYISPPEGRLFSARCRKGAATDTLMPEACLWRFREDGLDVQVRFPPELLVQWEEMSLRTRALLSRLRRG
jgi:hypothetical protein